MEGGLSGKVKAANLENSGKLAPIVRLRTINVFELVVDLEDFFDVDSAAPYQSQRKARVREAIAQRLRRICAHMPETAFQEMVDDMADKQLSGERRLSDM